MGYFKLKRQHAPDPIGVENYKRRRLLQDFANLSLSSKPSVTTEPKVTKVLSEDIFVPDNVKNKLLKFSRGSTTSLSSSAEAIYEKIKEWIVEDNSQIIKWIDWRQELFHMWYSWYQNQWYINAEMDIDDNNNIIQQQTDNIIQQNTGNIITNNEFDERMDVDMDAPY
ncbi:hypothetical protein C6P45_000453 [Maudiozyma exigua]|uniref:Uncharacterized protein n=1 Tax=Maudiozyma exigua TaxID=34358 RepID=A0A9P6W816_MAUEX|nr:hypothetical protein C6P45_000453 [Kazachstania exigua]